VQKADLQPAAGCSPEQVVLDETVVKIDEERYWLYAAVVPDTNRILHIKLYSARNHGVTKQFLRELQEKHEVEEAAFLVDGAPWLHSALHERGLRCRHEPVGERNPVERVFQEITRRTEQFSNTCSRADLESADSWLHALACLENQLLCTVPWVQPRA